MSSDLNKPKSGDVGGVQGAGNYFAEKAEQANASYMGDAPNPVETECGCTGCQERRAAARYASTFSNSAEYSEKQAYELLERAQRNRRAAELIAKHPEFPDLLELLSIVPVQFIKAA